MGGQQPQCTQADKNRQPGAAAAAAAAVDDDDDYDDDSIYNNEVVVCVDATEKDTQDDSEDGKKLRERVYRSRIYWKSRSTPKLTSRRFNRQRVWLVVISL